MVSNFTFFLTSHLTTPEHCVVTTLPPHCQCTLHAHLQGRDREGGWGGVGEEEERGEYNTQHAAHGRSLTHIRLEEELQMLVRRLRKFGRAEKERHHN